MDRYYKLGKLTAQQQFTPDSPLKDPSVQTMAQSLDTSSLPRAGGAPGTNQTDTPAGSSRSTSPLFPTAPTGQLGIHQPATLTRP